MPIKIRPLILISTGDGSSQFSCSHMDIMEKKYEVWNFIPRQQLIVQISSGWIFVVD